MVETRRHGLETNWPTLLGQMEGLCYGVLEILVLSSFPTPSMHAIIAVSLLAQAEPLALLVSDGASAKGVLFVHTLVSSLSALNKVWGEIGSADGRGYSG
jgi:hypothetical protein